VRITSRAEFYNIYTKIVDYTWIGPEVSISGNLHGHINIGSLVDFAPRAIIVSGTHELGDRTRRAGKESAAHIDIGDGTWIGANCTIIAGAHIGCGSVVTASSVVVAGDYPNNVLLAGVPAIVKKSLDNV
jgi:maltose O-acetyltransferase